eukprot:TRINITY_DN3435_c0_g1_i3.p1 TRINITY_DN3435_c0_g1~~TRINITY_DN3435_c0_g1_i3.p1  ORF type:complete len:1071 (-),score=240.16 TRINITY_DN3435_c0_g1_i3:89-3301(-)
MREVVSTSMKRNHQSSQEDNNRPSKRPRNNDSELTTGPPVTHRPGSVVKISLINFITYDEVEITPGAKLNVVIGPNGSGKSTIVSALALGLGANAKVMGKGQSARAEDVKNYIKLGKDMATVEIVLRGKGKSNISIKRTIVKQGQDRWKINNKNSTKEEVKGIVDDLGIQVDNLCQFLPQDRVVAFAKLTPQDLLRETEKAIDHALYDNHMELIELKSKQNTNEMSLENQIKIYEELKAKYNELEPEVSRFQKRKKLLGKIELLNAKLPWMEYEIQLRSTKELKKLWEEIQGEVATEERRLAPFKEDVVKITNLAAEAKRQQTEKKEQLSRLDADRKSVGTQLENMLEAFDREKRELGSLEERQKSRVKRIEEVKNKIKAIEKELENFDSEELLKNKESVINEKESNVQKKLESYQNEQGDIENKRYKLLNQQKDIANQLKALEDKDRIKRNNFKNRYHDAYTAYEWISKNANRFKKRIIGPIALEINVDNNLHANFIEVCIGQSLSAFIAEDQDDRRLLQSELSERMKLEIRIFYTDPSSLSELDNPCRIEDLRRFNITGFLDKLIISDKLVKQTLNNMHNICGQVYSLQNDVPLKDFWNSVNGAPIPVYTPSSIHIQKTSKHGNRDKWTNSNPMREARVLCASNANRAAENNLNERKKDIAREIQMLEEANKELMNKITSENAELKELRNQRDVIGKTRGRKRTKQQELVARKRELDEHLKEENVQEKREKILENMKNIALSRLEKAKKLTNIIQKLTEETMKMDSIIVKRMDLNIDLKLKELSLRKEATNLEKLKEKCSMSEKALKAAKNQLISLKEKANSICPLTEEITQKFQELPSDIDELKDKIAIYQGKADAIFVNDNRILQEFETVKTKLEEKERELEGLKSDVGRSKDKMKNLEVTWLKRLEEIVEKLSGKFAGLMKNIKCLGKIELDKTENYAEWGIKILVSFRPPAKLEVLDSHKQSGGERSVSTMLYLISLQDMSKSPFRLVDEINQGMDAKNERMVMEQIIKMAGIEGLPQYFLITPKLLPDLDFDDNTTILCVFNGPYIPAQWSPFPAMQNGDSNS